MGTSRRDSLRSLLLLPLAAAAGGGQSAEQSQSSDNDLSFPRKPPDEPRLPNGKSQRDEMARDEHRNALKEADELVAKAEELREDLKQAGEYTVRVGSVRKTEEIEKLAKRIRGRLKN